MLRRLALFIGLSLLVVVPVNAADMVAQVVPVEQEVIDVIERLGIVGLTVIGLLTLWRTYDARNREFIAHLEEENATWRSYFLARRGEDGTASVQPRLKVGNGP